MRISDWSSDVCSSDLLRTAAVAGVVGLLCFVPPWLQADRTLQFLDSGLGFEGFGINAGRWAVKNAVVIGIPAGIVMIIGIQRILGEGARGTVSVVVRVELMTRVVSELILLRLRLNTRSEERRV